MQVVAATSVGQSNFNAFFRIVGTLFGAAVALVAYQVTGHRPVLLFLVGFVFSLPNFWLIVTKPKWATTGRLVLLSEDFHANTRHYKLISRAPTAYNLTALYAYNKREEEINIVTIAFRRSTAVVIGAMWAFLLFASSSL